MTNNDGATVATRIQKIACIARCNSAETLRTAMELAERVIHPNTEIVKTFVTLPGGAETRAFRLGDYFSEIELLPSESDDASFSLVFHIREDVTSFWKDLLVAVLREISENVPGVKTGIVPGGAKP